MLEIRPSCENCDKELKMDSTDAMICTFECTFCVECVKNILMNVCPNCGGGFEKRPVRPKEYLSKYPPTEKKTFKPIDEELFYKTLKEKQNIPPNLR